MKTTMKTLQRITMCTLLILFLGCSKDEDSPSPGDGELEQINGISEDDLEKYEGDLGLRVSARDLVKKGYLPKQVAFDFDANTGDYDQTIDIDEFTNIAQLSIAVEDLSIEAEAELRNGVPIVVTVLDDNNVAILTESISIQSLEENGADIPLNISQLEEITNEIDFMPNMPHFIQLVDGNGNYSNRVVSKPENVGDNNTLLYDSGTNFDPNTTWKQVYLEKLPNEENVFVVYLKETGRYLMITDQGRNFKQSGGVSYPTGIAGNTLNGQYKIKIVRESNGLYTFRKYSDGIALTRNSNSTGTYWNAEGGTLQYFRILALDAQWDAQQLETRSLAPILPAVDTSFGFNSTLVNCGNGNLSQEVGIIREVTTSYTSGYEETIGLSSRVTASVSATVSATAEASFFGNGGSVTGEVSTSLEVSVEATSSSTQSTEFTNTNTESYFSNRTVNVLPGTASLVYDAYQTYSNVQIPFVKRFRIKANQLDPLNNNALVGTMSGDAIATQLRITNFSGVITSIGSDFVELTVRGTTVLDNIIEIQSDVQNVAANCN